MWQSLFKGHFSPKLVFPIGKLEQGKYVWNVNSFMSCQQCRTVSTVIARCYLHLRWYFFQLLSYSQSSTSTFCICYQQHQHYQIRVLFSSQSLQSSWLTTTMMTMMFHTQALRNGAICLLICGSWLAQWFWALCQGVLALSTRFSSTNFQRLVIFNAVTSFTSSAVVLKIG